MWAVSRQQAPRQVHARNSCEYGYVLCYQLIRSRILDSRFQSLFNLGLGWMIALNSTMSNLSEAVKRALFTGSQTGRGVCAFFIASTVVGSTIFVLSMTRVFDTDSTYIISFFATLLHHYIIFLFLSDEAKASGINLNPPTQARFAALRHQSNFPVLVLLAMSWLACAAYYLMVYSLENS